MNTKISINVIMKIVNILFLIVLENFVLDSGMGFFSASGLVIALLYMLLFGGIQSGISKMVSIRNNKGLNGNAKRILKPALFYVLAVGAICVLGNLFFADNFSAGVWGVSYPASVLKLLSLIIIFNGVSDALCGYHNGNGNGVVGNIANVLRMVLPIVFAFVFLPSFEKYGDKVSALLKNTLATRAYMALAIACIYFTCSVVVFLVVVVLTVRLRIPHTDDKQIRSMNSKRAMYGGILSTTFKISLNQIFPLMSIAVVIVLYLHLAHKCGVKPESTFINAGILFSKLFLPIAFVFTIFSEYVAREKYRLHLDYRKEEHKTALIRAQYMIKNSFFMLLPPAIILTFLADPFVKVFYTGQYALSAKFVQAGGFLILFAGVAHVLNSILKAAEKEITALIIQIAAFLVQIVFLFMTLSGSNGNSMLIVYSFYLYFAIQIVVNFMVLYRFMRFDLMDILVKLGKYGVAAIVMMILFIILDKFVLMNVLLILLSMFFGYLLYYLTLLALKGISKKDEMALKRTLNYYPVTFLKSRLRL